MTDDSTRGSDAPRIVVRVVDALAKWGEVLSSFGRSRRGGASPLSEQLVQALAERRAGREPVTRKQLEAGA